MNGALDQLLLLLANRGLEWLRQKIMDLPDPCPADGPDLRALALAAQTAPILTGLRGRISPLEVIVLRRLTPATLRAGAGQILAGDHSDALIDLMLAGGTVAPNDPLWQLARETLAERADLPLAQRLALSDDPVLLREVEALLFAPMPAQETTAAHVAQVTDLVMQLYHWGARRPALSHPRAFAQLFDRLQGLARWSRAARCTQSLARIAFCLCLIDPDHDLSDLLADLLPIQRGDGSFPPRLGVGVQNQSLAQGIRPTLLVVMLLHMAAFRRWRGVKPIARCPRPLRGALREGGQAVARLAVAGTPADAALLLTRATGENWLQRLAPPAPNAADLPRLAQMCFRDPVAARHLRQWLDQGGVLPGPWQPEMQDQDRWLRGRPVMLRGPVPPALAALWERAAAAGDVPAFLACARLALHHQDGPPTPIVRSGARSLAAQALAGCHLPALADALPHLERLVLLAQVFGDDDRLMAAA